MVSISYNFDQRQKRKKTLKLLKKKKNYGDSRQFKEKFHTDYKISYKYNNFKKLSLNFLKKINLK